MDIKEYISSGILEAYVLGALDKKEQEGVEAAIHAYPELADELAAIEAAMQVFAEAHATPPPAHLQQQVWNAIQVQSTGNKVPAGSTQKNDTVIPATIHNETTEQEKGRVIEFPRRERSNQLRWQRAAVLIALVGSLLVNFMFWMQRNDMQQNQVAMQQQMDTLKQQQQQLAQLADHYRKEKEMMADPSMQTIVMRTMQKDHPMAATVYWSKDKGDTYLAVQKLPMPPQGMQYQLWVINKEGKPVDMGVIENDMVVQDKMTKVSHTAPGENVAFAISLEKAGGSPVPTMENIYVMGKVAS
ncbi:anti-sigma factor [Chitinophagaceae bacterium MMS25-I14]